jgi:hypothetical protein
LCRENALAFSPYKFNIMRIFRFFNLLLVMIAWVGCDQKGGKSDWNIDEQEYLETPGFNVLVFNDYYTEGDQGG